MRKMGSLVIRLKVPILEEIIIQLNKLTQLG